MKFIRSEFRGQLPKPYSLHANATKIIPTDMNNMNKEEESRYVSKKRERFVFWKRSYHPIPVWQMYVAIQFSLISTLRNGYIFVLIQIDVKYCHFLMDLSTSRITLLEPSYTLDRKNWDVVISKPFLDSYRLVGIFECSVYFENVSISSFITIWPNVASDVKL